MSLRMIHSTDGATIDFPAGNTLNINGNIKAQNLSSVAFSGSYNDLTNKPTIKNGGTLHSYYQVDVTGVATNDCFLVVTVSSGTGNRECYINGVLVTENAGRDRYGTGPTSFTVPVPKGASWSITGGITRVMAIDLY